MGVERRVTESFLNAGRGGEAAKFIRSVLQQSLGTLASRCSLEIMSELTIVRGFFETYTRALLARDAKAIAGYYAVPALIVFPQQVIAVSDIDQTEKFFAGAFDQYESVTTADPTVEVVAATSHSIWVDVTWNYRGGAPEERNMYQLVRNGAVWKIAVLTPLDASFRG